ncbi:hypothetical protein L3Q82_008772 [Scortum barcoo]|uniref:Uncharacterized protein n=1 Tax=Scortum barcoo TaxID=214431 RepID=A0ACB8XBV2_9TELE|nr:hypothetical protein L3Q82_008772 [Scortum barcoo]
MRGRCNVVWVAAVVAGGLDDDQSLDQNSGNRDMECHLAWGGRSLSLKVREVERYRLEIVGLTSTHSLGSGTQLLERGWTLHYSGVAQGERRRAGVGLLIAPQLSRHVLEFTPVNERVASLRLRVGDRGSCCCLCIRAEQQYRQSTRPSSWSPWEGARGTRDTLGRRSMIDFVVVSSDLRPYVLDTFGNPRTRWWTPSPIGPCWPVGLLTQLTGYRQAKQAAARTVLEAKTRVWEEFVQGGELLTSTGDIVGRWKKYFEDLLNPTDLPSSEEAEAGDSEVDSSITRAEVTEVVVRKLLGGKAPGVDEIRPEYLKSLDVVGLSWLTRLCNIAWRLGTVPLEWQTKGWWSLFLKRGTGECVPTTGGSHFSASPGRSTPQGTGEENSADSRPSDSGGTMRFSSRVVEHWTSSILSAGCLRVYGSLPNQSTCALWIWRRHSTVSLVVFCGECSDDVVLLASSSQDLQHVLERFAAECEAAGMRISTSKSEAMVLDRKRVACPLRVGGEVLPQVEEFKYLQVSRGLVHE